MSLQVELDAFSGRPNPRWELTEAQKEEFLSMLRELNPAERQSSTLGGLGYRGFVVRGKERSVNGYDEVRIVHGIVEALSVDHSDSFNDPERHLERFLLRSAYGHVPESVLQYIQKEIAE